MSEPTKRKKPQHVASDLRKAEEVKERRHRAYDLWFNEKKSLRAVGDELGVSYETVRSDLHAKIAEIADEFDDEVRTWRAKQIERLMRKHNRFEKIESDENASIIDRTRAGTLCLGILKEISDITNVKAPVKIQHSGDLSFSWSELSSEAKDAKNLTDES